MVRISIMYPADPGARFDFGYYTETHMPRSIELLGAHPGFAGVSVERGLAGGVPGTAATYTAMCHYQFDSLDSFMAAFTPHAAALQGDMKNYTDIEPVIQISDVLLSR